MTVRPLVFGVLTGATLGVLWLLVPWLDGQWAATGYWPW